jgi:hypothetical protein
MARTSTMQPVMRVPHHVIDLNTWTTYCLPGARSASIYLRPRRLGINRSARGIVQ